jgi:hypothetical protein
MGIDGNGTANPLTGHQPALGISAKAARGTIWGWANREHKYWQSIHGQRQAKGFLRRCSAKKAGELLKFSRNQLRIMTGLLIAHCHVKGHVFTLGLVSSPECYRFEQASETALHVLCDCQALATSGFRHLG